MSKEPAAPQREQERDRELGDVVLRQEGPRGRAAFALRPLLFCAFFLLCIDGVLRLVEKGVITGRMKAVHPGKLVAGFVVGTRRVYDFLDDNPQVAMLDIGYVNDPNVIRRNPKVTAINSAIEIDLTGQICTDSIGTRI